MKDKRRVMVVVELDTRQTLADLRKKQRYVTWADDVVHQVQVNVAQDEKPAFTREHSKKK